MVKKLLSILLALFLLLPFASCSSGGVGEETSGGQSRDYPVKVNEVTIKSAPKSVAVLSGSLADVIIACGYEILVGARSSDCIQAAVALHPDVGDPYAPDIDALIELKVDVVLVDAPMDASNQTMLEESGIPVVTIVPAVSRADFERLYTEVCSVLNGGKTGYEKGVEISDSIYLSIDWIGQVIPTTDTPPTACYVYNTEGEIATGDTLAGKLIEAAGAFNIAADNTDFVMDGEQIAIANPSFIFCAEGVKDSIVSGSRFSDLQAVKEQHVYEIPANLMLWQGKTVIEAVSTMAEIMYPSMVDEDEESSSTHESASNDASSHTGEESISSDSGNDSSSAPSSEYQTLRPGDSGPAVKALQERLIELGYLNGKADGDYGTSTTNAVSNFQLKADGLTADGVAGAKTQEKLFASDAPKA